MAVGRRRRGLEALAWAMMRAVAPAAFAAMTAAAPAAWAAPRPEEHAAARLLDGGSLGPGRRLAGVEIRLDPGFITYWRSPGEAGLAPAFDFSASVNLGEARVDYPPPRRLDEGGVAASGYEGAVTFPVTVTARDPARPVTLALALDYAICAKVCLPAKARLTLALDASSPPEAPRLRGILAGIPRAATLGGEGPVRILSATPSGRFIAVEAATPDAAGALFAEAPEPWYFDVSPGRPLGGGRLAFTLTGPDPRPPGPPPVAPLRLTLVTPSGSIEVPVRLDAIAPKP